MFKEEGKQLEYVNDINVSCSLPEHVKGIIEAQKKVL